jgi:hypothetical protein
MTDQLDRVECATHGQAYATYVCEHLVRASGAEWYSAEPIDEDPWPGAWCKKCHAEFLTAGEWNEASEEAAGLKLSLLCHFCYEATKARCIVHVT